MDTLESHIPQCSVDIGTLVFALSAVHPDKMVAVLENIIQVNEGAAGALFSSKALMFGHKCSKIILCVFLAPSSPLGW